MKRILTMPVFAALLFLSQPSVAEAWPCPRAAGLSIPLPKSAIVKACLGDLDGDGQDEVVVAVVRATGKDGTFRPRLFVYSVRSGVLESKFCGTEGKGRLVDFGLADLDRDKHLEVLARERSDDGEEMRVYRWEGYGLVENKKLASRAPAYELEHAVVERPDFSSEVKIPPLLKELSLSFERAPGKIRRVRLKKDLSNAANRRKFRWLPRRARRSLVRDGFVVLRPGEPPPEFHSLYIENQYLGLPSLVTSDAALHLTHLLFDHAVSEIEQQVLAPALARLAVSLRTKAGLLAGKLPKELAPALDRLLLRLQIACALLEGDTWGLGAERAARVRAEVERISKASGGAENPLGIDYPAYKVRGHYTQSEALRRYFLAYLFLSQAGTTDPLEIELLAFLVFSDKRSRRALAWLEAFGSALSGPPANRTPLLLRERMRALFGDKPDFADLGAEGKKIEWNKEDPPVTLIARRWPADNALLTLGVDAEERPFPDPLDLLAALGSRRARELLEPQVKKWPELDKRLARGTREVRAGSSGDTKSVGGRWLLALRWLLLDYPKGYASFQTSRAWPERMLVCAAASWAELRRDTILYVQPPIMWAEGGDEESLPPARAGYVEPVPELYKELAVVLSSMRAALTAFGGEGFEKAYTRSPAPVQLLRDGEQLLDFLARMALRELSGRGLSRDEHEQLSYIGSSFEHILGGRGRLRLDPVPVIADVYYFGDPESGEKTPLLVATGPVDVIIAAVPLGRRVILARGAVSSFYHFIGTQPVSDEEWRKRLDSGKATEQPPWARPIKVRGRHARRAGH
ncbi:MAG TPA: DUF3160 domain-containing protein [Myxococcota bacterium]|nr:DUF3160 domain-containing protein [Myxococcota bacterium]